MLWYCAFTWYPGTIREEVGKRVLQQHDLGQNRPEQIRGFYNLVGGGAGFLIVEADDPQQIDGILMPYMDLMSFDVRAITEVDYDKLVADLNRQYGAA
jgi:hypothetical protein